MSIKLLSMNRGERIGAIILLCILVLVSVINISVDRSDVSVVDASVVERAKEATKFREEIAAQVATNDSVKPQKKRRIVKEKGSTENVRALLDDDVPNIIEK